MKYPQNILHTVSQMFMYFYVCNKLNNAFGGNQSEQFYID